MNWLQKLANTQIPEPGTIPIPPGHVRLYHYFPGNQIENIKQNGIDITHARGETYGEPNSIWASGQKPSDNHTFVEFSISKDDPSWLLNKPTTNEHAQAIQDYGSDVSFGRTIRPEEFVAIHEPWHNHYRYIMNDPQLLKEVQQGKFDYLLDNEGYAQAIRLIKLNVPEQKRTPQRK